MTNSSPSEEEKLKRILEKNTLFLPNNDFGKKYESEVISKKAELLIGLKKRIDSEGLSKTTIIEFIRQNSDGLECIFALTGLSREVFKRIITMARILNLQELNQLLNMAEWPQEEFENEWTEKKIQSLVKENKKIAEGIVNLFFDGSQNPIIKKSLELFEIKKLDKSKFSFSTESLIDTLIRYKIKGSFAGLKENNPETTIEQILLENKIKFTSGNIKGVSRRMDFIIPLKEKPEILIEVSKLKTTSSGMGDKAKTEGRVAAEIVQHYPNCKFIGFIDGIGWYVRLGDLKRMVLANVDVFTFEESELKRFSKFLKDNLSSECYATN